jgi:AcrR family transcriptional regulator
MTSRTSIQSSASRGGGARERVLETAYDLFTRYGVRAVGVDRIVAEAGVAKMTLYRHFRSKDELVLAVLERRERVWTREWLVWEVERRATRPEEQLLAIFDVFDEWFRRDDFEGCLFIKCVLERYDPTSSIAAESTLRLQNIRAIVQRLAEDSGVGDADGFARAWQFLMMGSIIGAMSGDPDAALHARAAGLLLLEQEGRTPRAA